LRDVDVCRREPAELVSCPKCWSYQSPPDSFRIPASGEHRGRATTQTLAANFQPRLINIPTTTVRNTRRMNPEPRLVATAVPSTLPDMLATAMTSPNPHRTLPAGTKNSSAPRLVAALTTFAVAEAFTNASPPRPTSRKTRKEPVPG